jgi:hypothetical protein
MDNMNSYNRNNNNRNYVPGRVPYARVLDTRSGAVGLVIAFILAIAVIGGILYFNYNAERAVQKQPPAAAAAVPGAETPAPSPADVP